jgi:dTDP-4-amino-4,6-dideoxy-D-galactose acyltransferase
MGLVAQSEKHLSRLDWDSEHFGFKVGRIAGETSNEDLGGALHTAREQQYRLIYWSTPAVREAPEQLLGDFDGLLVDRKLTYARILPARDACPRLAKAQSVQPWVQRTASPELEALAVAAGVYSRFGVDKRIPRQEFRALYRIWIDRSVRREIADVVLVAYDQESAGNAQGQRSSLPISGMVTVRVLNGVGNIGLIAVAESQRGRGVGSRLIAGAHQWMLDHGAAKATVVTQSANLPACRLYERNGYLLEQAENYYHFWP